MSPTLAPPATNASGSWRTTVLAGWVLFILIGFGVSFASWITCSASDSDLPTTEGTSTFCWMYRW